MENPCGARFRDALEVVGVSGSSGGNYNFGDPDKNLTDPDDNNSGQGTRPFGSNGPTV